MIDTTGPFQRVWFSRTGGSKVHHSPNCAAHGGDHGPIPSFQAFAEDVEAEPCSICAENYQTAETPADVPVGDDLRDLRDTLGVTQAQLAVRLGVGKGTVANWESQGVTPTPETAAKLQAIREEAEAVDEDADDDESMGVDDKSAHICEDCGESFRHERGLRGHRSHTTCGSCETCADLDGHTLEWFIHRTEEHDITQSALGDLEPGEFETLAAQAETVLDLADALGWRPHRTIRALQIYELADEFGVGRPRESPDGDESWRQYYQAGQGDAVTDGGAR